MIKSSVGTEGFILTDSPAGVWCDGVVVVYSPLWPEKHGSLEDNGWHFLSTQEAENENRK